MTENRHKWRQRPKLLFQQTEFSEAVDLVSQQVHLVEKGSQNFSEPSSKSQESKKTNGVQIQLRMTENRHKRCQRPKLLFQQTEFSETDDLVSQPVHPVERGSQNFSDPSSKSQESKKTNGVQIRLRMTENRHKQYKRPKLLFQQTEFNEPDDLVYQPVQPVERGSQNLSEPFSNSQKSNKINGVQIRLRMAENRHKRCLVS